MNKQNAPRRFSDELVSKAHSIAMENLDKSYAPYSKFHVSAVIYSQRDEQFYTGVNVENASYGATICAERAAVLQAVSQAGKPSFDFLVLVSSAKGMIIPCGMCIQVLNEFCNDDFSLYLYSDDGNYHLHSLAEMMPIAFKKEHLNRT